MEDIVRTDAAQRAACSRAESPAPAAEFERPPRIIGAFRAAPPMPQRAQSRGRSPSCGDNCVPRASSAGRCGRDIVAENRAAVGQRRASSAGRVPPKDVKFARNGSNVPLYLQKVKAAIADEERFVAHQLGVGRDPDVPPDHRLLTDDERRDIVAGLQKRKADLEAKNSRLPLHVDTQAQKQRADDLEKALREVERDITRISRSRVLVKL